MPSLKEIRKPIESDLKMFEKHFKESMKSKTPLLDKITYYIVQRKGKQMRPMFVFLSAKITGTVNDSTYVAASLVELLHTATLVHDDVVDDADKRRGFFSVNAIWKNKIAVLVGDYLLSRGLLIALESKKYILLEILSRAVQAMSEGELLQIEKARRLDIKEEIYYQIIEQKTASLIAASCSAGTASVTDDSSRIELMRQFGEKVGMAFQIKDDLFDYGTKDIGKPVGIDIKEKKMTLPLIFALNQGTRQEKKRIINHIKKGKPDNQKLNEIISYVKDKGGLEYAKKVMLKYRDEALVLLNQFEASEAKSSMIQLVNYVIDREK